MLDSKTDHLPRQKGGSSFKTPTLPTKHGGKALGAPILLLTQTAYARGGSDVSRTRAPTVIFARAASSAFSLAEVVFDANRGDRNLADLVVAQNFELDDLTRVMAVDRIVQRAPIVDLALVGRQHHVALLKPGLLPRAPRHHAGDHHVLAQRV